MVRRPPRSTRTDPLVPYTTLFRSYNRAIRAPTLNELYSPITRGFSSGSDPCEASRNPTQAQQDLCVAQGVPRADLPTFTQATLGFNVDGGGNPNLEEEKSETFTLGAVISPPRSEERRVGKELVRTFRSRWSPYHYKKKKSTSRRNKN